jgi:hypothetical protein
VKAPPIALDQSGRLLVVSANGLERFDTDGQNGVVLDRIAMTESIQVDSRGRIILFRPEQIERRLSDGSLDPRFAGDGATSGRTGLPVSTAEYRAMALAADDGILLAGDFGQFFNEGNRFGPCVAKLSGTNPTTPAYRYEPGEILLINGTEQADRIRVFGEGDTVTVTVGSTTQTFAADDVQNIAIYGFGGNDDIEAGVSFIDCVAYGGSGNDVINLRRFRHATSYGESGNDTLKIFARDRGAISGGAGNDTIGIDLFSGNSRAAGATGGDGNDLMIGGRQKDSFHGDAGDDTIRGMGGQDRLFGNLGNDVLEGGDSGDLHSGGSGNDTLIGGAGGDGLEGGAGDDFYDTRGGGTDQIREYGGTFYGNDRARVDEDDLVDSNVEVVLVG